MKWIGKILLICGILLSLEPSLGSRAFWEERVLELSTKWQIVLIVIGFFLMNVKSKRKSHR